MTHSDPARREELRQRIRAVPRVHLAHLPTPLEHCPRLACALGGPDLYIKRDDLTGLAFGGNKTRQLEFLLADMVEKEADVIVVGAYTQSNWCRQITAAARKLERDVSLVLLHGEKGPVRQGNLLLDDLMGADITVTDIDDMQDLPPLLEEKAEAHRAAGRRPYLINPFDLDILARSTVGYVEAAIELEGARVVDVFAGSGAFACEALSRGAAHAVCLDRSPLAVAAIAANAKSLAAEAALTVLCRDARRPGPPPPAVAAGCALAFFDPPYGSGLLNPALAALADHGWLVAGALAVTETAARESPAPPARFTLVKERRYGDAHIAILRWQGGEG